MGKKKKKRNKKGLVILLLVILVFVIFFAACAIKGYKLFQLARQTKYNAEGFINSVLTNDIDAAELQYNEIQVAVEEFSEFFDSEIGRIATSFVRAFTEYGQDLENGKRILEIAQEGLLKYKEPLLSRLKQYPLSSLKVEGGFNGAMIASYVQLLPDIMPDALAWMDEISAMEFKIEYKGFVAKYMGLLKEVDSLAHDVEEYIPFLCDFFGDGEDKFYLLVAQNSAEIRGCGGFPGSVGIIKIQDGVLTIGDFESGWNVFPYWTYNYDSLTYIERYMTWWYVQYPRDLEYLPNYEKVGKLWAENYESIHSGVSVDGVVSLTPVIIQDILSAVGEIEVSDGTVLTGDNATYWIQHQWYLVYENDEALSDNFYGNEEIINGLFAETAEKTMAKLFDSLNLDSIPQLIDIVEQRIEDRVIMVWMKDETAQSHVKELGMSGGLNDDPQNPAVGVFLSNEQASKMGWYVDIDTEITYIRKLSDGSNEYSIKVRISNNMAFEEKSKVGWWTAGVYSEGTIFAIFQMFAPAGGDIYDYSMEISNTTEPVLETITYNGLKAVICREFNLWAENYCVITAKFTTAPGVETEPTVYKTPTLTEYRKAYEASIE